MRKDDGPMLLRYAVLVDWTGHPSHPNHGHELLAGPFSLAGAEEVADEKRRLGATGASVHTQAVARTLFLKGPGACCEHAPGCNPHPGEERRS